MKLIALLAGSIAGNMIATIIITSPALALAHLVTGAVLGLAAAAGVITTAIITVRQLRRLYFELIS